MSPKSYQQGVRNPNAVSWRRYASEKSSLKEIFLKPLSFSGGSSNSSGDWQGRSPGGSRSISSGSLRPPLALSGGAVLRFLSKILSRSDEIRLGRNLQFVLPAEVAEVGLF